MSVVSVAPIESIQPQMVRVPRTMRVGLLGLGNVGQAVVRAIHDAGDALRARGLAMRVDAALVRDPHRVRTCPRVPRITNNPEAFLRGRYDVVIEAMGGVEPARTLVARLLGRGVAVVTANKALVAEQGDGLHRIARRRGAAFRYEATALAGVPFIGAFSRRPLVSSLTSLTGIVNGTSNYVLTTVARGGAVCIGDALREAQARGYAEPDASFDVSGRDAADKLVVLLRECGGVTVNRRQLEVAGIESLTGADLAAARELGGTIKPVIHASIGDSVRAWVGPAFVPCQHPLARVDGALNGVCLASRYVPDLFFSGPGAGPDVTAATLVDDVVEIADHRDRVDREPWRAPAATLPLRPAESGWFLRVSGRSVDPGRVSTLLAEHEIEIRSAGLKPCATLGSAAPGGGAALQGCVVVTGRADRPRVEHLADRLRLSCAADVLAIRTLDV